MKYLYLIIAIVVLSTQAQAKQFPTVTFTEDATKVIAEIPTSGGMWEATVRIAPAGGTDFGGGTVKIIHADKSDCTTNAIYETDMTDVVYSTTEQATPLFKIGTNKTQKTYLCAELSGSTSPDLDVIASDYQ